MTRSESQFRSWFLSNHPNAFVVKFPDFKQTGMSHCAGVPDYLTIRGGLTVWYEVKTWRSRSLTPAQKVVFRRMVDAGAVIYIWIKLVRGYKIEKFV